MKSLALATNIVHAFLVTNQGIGTIGYAPVFENKGQGLVSTFNILNILIVEFLVYPTIYECFRSKYYLLFRVNSCFYSFIIGGDGNIYEGAGWHKEGAHTYGYNKKSIGIAFIGDFRS